MNESVEIGIWTRGIGFLSRLDLVIKKRRLNLPDSLTAIPKKGMRAGRRKPVVGLLKELIKLPTRADNSQSAREVQGTGQARSMQRNTKQERNL